MTNRLENSYERLDITIRWLKFFLVALILLVVFTDLFKYDFCLSFSCLVNFFIRISDITKTIITLLAALLATLVADRHITHSKINIENEQHSEVVQVTHRYIAIAKDLKANVSFLKHMFDQGGFTISALTVVADTIEKRYETLFEKDAYKYLPGSAVDLINEMSGSIAGIKMSIANIKKSAIGQVAEPLLLPPVSNGMPVDSLLKEIDLLIDKLYELRKSIEA